MEWLLGVVVGFVLGRLGSGGLPWPKPAPKGDETPPTEAQLRQARREWREYANFMSYDGTPQQENEEDDG